MFSWQTTTRKPGWLPNTSEETDAGLCLQRENLNSSERGRQCFEIEEKIFQRVF